MSWKRRKMRPMAALGGILRMHDTLIAQDVLAAVAAQTELSLATKAIGDAVLAQQRELESTRAALASLALSPSFMSTMESLAQSTQAMELVGRDLAKSMATMTDAAVASLLPLRTSLEALQAVSQSTLCPSSVAAIASLGRLYSPAATTAGRIVRRLEAPADIVGEFEVEGAKSTTSTEPLVSDAPERMTETLRRVDFLPLHLIDAILQSPDLLHSVSPREFEIVVAELLERVGFERVQLTPQSGDGGRDILATARVGGIPMVCAVECKRFAPENKVGVEFVRALLGTISTPDTKANMGILVTTSGFTSGASKLILADTLLDGRDFDGVCEWIEFAKGNKAARATE